MELIIQIVGILFWFVVILIPLVVIHEFGHLLMARLVGVKVLEFGVGIPPRVWYKKWKGIIWSINAIWLGGFAKIYGDHDALDEAAQSNDQDPDTTKENYISQRINEIIVGKETEFFLEDNNIAFDDNWKEFEKSGYAFGSRDFTAKDLEKFALQQKQLETLVSWELDNKINSPTAFFNKNIWQKTLILLGGIIFNLIAAFVIFSLLIGVFGTPATPMLLEDVRSLDPGITVQSKSNNVVVLGVIKDSIAYQAGLRGGDSLLRFAGSELNNLESFEKFAQLVDQNKNQNIPITYIEKKTGVEITKDVFLATNKDGQAVFGIKNQGFGYLVSLKANNFVDSIRLGAKQTWTIFKLNFQILGKIGQALWPFSTDRSALNAVGGPVAVGSVGNQIFNLQGVNGILNVMGSISVSLAAFNLLPLPALDGGRLLIILVNRLTGRRNKKLEGSLIGVTFVVLLCLSLLIAFKDVNNIVDGKSLF
jgi:regulator of sigma E protease